MSAPRPPRSQAKAEQRGSDQVEEKDDGGADAAPSSPPLSGATGSSASKVQLNLPPSPPPAARPQMGMGAVVATAVAVKGSYFKRRKQRKVCTAASALLTPPPPHASRRYPLRVVARRRALARVASQRLPPTLARASWLPSCACRTRPAAVCPTGACTGGGGEAASHGAAAGGRQGAARPRGMATAAHGLGLCRPRPPFLAAVPRPQAGTAHALCTNRCVFR